jgi:putative ABC transport system permease protein
MGTALVIIRLAARDVRRHFGQAALLVVAIAAAAATLTMGIALSGVTSQSPYAATRAATKSPDVVAYVSSIRQGTKLAGDSGVAIHNGPYPVASAVIRFDGRLADVFAEGRPEAPAALDRPFLTAGRWVHPGDIHRGEPGGLVFLGILSNYLQDPLSVTARKEGSQQFRRCGPDLDD